MTRISFQPYSFSSSLIKSLSEMPHNVQYLLDLRYVIEVSQRLMVQGYSGHASYKGGLDVARKVLKSESIRLLYRGFSLSVLTYSPSSAVWWASYGSSQRFIWSRLLDNGTEHGGPSPSQRKIVAVQAAGGIIAGATASCITTPLDTIKTRLQVMRHDKRPTARQVVKQLIVEDGWTGFYRGLGPRFVSVVTSMILAYEPPDDSSCSRVFILLPYSFGAGDI
ncbi:uncharacterized protein LOC132621676 [Lycium barbarum]|uniref:uncharacterized protein LOC132621676 n=1 Tax=Lycium barbarum TaxID=112863 RepID=UPI00293E83AD|nr:uncharacterized protein LOC132621676 [Lycium barbarum]